MFFFTTLSGNGKGFSPAEGEGGGGTQSFEVLTRELEVLAIARPTDGGGGTTSFTLS